ncbi:MAG: hypothetical protein ACYSSO_13035, partial [Planctomycetota bacterium]
ACISFVIAGVVISIVCRNNEERLRLEWENFFCIFMPWIFFPNTRWRVRTMQRHSELVPKINKHRTAREPAITYYDEALAELRHNKPELFTDNNCPEQC